MVATSLFTDHAERASLRYQGIDHGLAGAYSKAVNSRDPFVASVIGDLNTTGFNLATSYLEVENQAIQEQTSKLALQALADAEQALGVGKESPELPDALVTHLNAAQEHLSNVIATQLERDIAQNAKRFRDALLRANIQALTTGISRRNIMASLKAKGADGPLFFYTDRMSRKWPSHKFVRGEVRLHYLRAYVDSYIFGLAQNGETHAKVIYPDAQNPNHGRVIALAGEGPDTYDEVLNEIFHPNSDALLVPFDSND
jgi:hypothetical protein